MIDRIFDLPVESVTFAGVEFRAAPWGGFVHGDIDVLPERGEARDYSTGDSTPTVFNLHTVQGVKDFERWLMGRKA